MAKKTKNEKTIKPHKALITSFSLLFLVIALFFFKANLIAVSEAETVMQLKADVVSIQKDFNGVSEGWAYDEYCRGYGTDVARNNAISCYFVLKNSSDASNEHYDTYLQKLDKYKFKPIRPTETIKDRNNSAMQYKATRLNNPAYKNTYCTIIDKLGDSNGSTGYYFECSISTRKFYFERRD